MKVTTLWVYPIKALRGINLTKAELGPQGIRHDRTFMLCRVAENGELKKVQLSSYPQCALFSQEIIDGVIHVRYHAPPDGEDEAASPKPEILEVPLEPDVQQLAKSDVNVHSSVVNAYRMGSPYDEWFSACFGFETALLYIGDGRRPVLGTFSPKTTAVKPAKGWFSSVAGYLGGGSSENDEPDYLAFSDCAPFLIATEASLRNVSRRLESGDAEMMKFRPNIVVDGEGEWDEDFWTELTVPSSSGQNDSGADLGFTLSKMCGRCTSVNVDYTTGKTAAGERGFVLKKLMSDRRVDTGNKWSPVFGRYAFLKDNGRGVGRLSIEVGDTIEVAGRSEERPVWDWPMSSKAPPRFYGQPI